MLLAHDSVNKHLPKFGKFLSNPIEAFGESSKVTETELLTNRRRQFAGLHRRLDELLRWTTEGWPAVHSDRNYTRHRKGRHKAAMSIEHKLTTIERRLGTLAWLAGVNLVSSLGVLWLAFHSL